VLKQKLQRGIVTKWPIERSCSSVASHVRIAMLDQTA